MASASPGPKLDRPFSTRRLHTWSWTAKIHRVLYCSAGRDGERRVCGRVLKRLFPRVLLCVRISLSVRSHLGSYGFTF